MFARWGGMPGRNGGNPANGGGGGRAAGNGKSAVGAEGVRVVEELDGVTDKGGEVVDGCDVTTGCDGMTDWGSVTVASAESTVLGSLLTAASFDGSDTAAAMDDTGVVSMLISGLMSTAAGSRAFAVTFRHTHTHAN